MYLKKYDFLVFLSRDTHLLTFQLYLCSGTLAACNCLRCNLKEGWFSFWNLMLNKSSKSFFGGSEPEHIIKFLGIYEIIDLKAAAGVKQFR